MRNILIVVVATTLSCSGSNNEPTNNTSTGTTSNDTTVAVFKEIALRITNNRDMPVYVPGRPFVAHHKDEVVPVAWDGCGCGEVCNQNFGPSFALASSVTVAEVWYGTLLDDTECNIANDLIGQTLEIEVCWSEQVDGDMALFDPTCERKPVTPGTSAEVVFSIE